MKRIHHDVTTLSYSNHSERCKTMPHKDSNGGLEWRRALSQNYLLRPTVFKMNKAIV